MNKMWNHQSCGYRAANIQWLHQPFIGIFKRLSLQLHWLRCQGQVHMDGCLLNLGGHPKGLVLGRLHNHCARLRSLVLWVSPASDQRYQTISKLDKWDVHHSGVPKAILKCRHLGIKHGNGHYHVESKTTYIKLRHGKCSIARQEFARERLQRSPHPERYRVPAPTQQHRRGAFLRR